MYKMAVMGDKASIFGFASLGISTFPIEDEREAKALLKKLTKNGYAVIYVTEALADKIKEEIDKYRSLSLPAIILIPGIVGNTGAGMRDVSRSVEKAVGSDIL